MLPGNQSPRQRRESHLDNLGAVDSREPCFVDAYWRGHGCLQPSTGRAVNSPVRHLGQSCEKLVFVGGCVTGILISDMARPPVRATQDVDLIAEIASKAEYYEIAADLRRLGFQEDLGEVICRWRFGNLKVDVMPSREGILNFTN
jgi:hypothetical protein